MRLPPPPLLLLLLWALRPAAPGPWHPRARSPQLQARLWPRRLRPLAPVLGPRPSTAPAGLRDLHVPAPRPSLPPPAPLLRGPRVAGLRLRLRAPTSWSLPRRPRLESRWRAPAGRGRRSAQAHDSCPLGPGRCCRLLSLRASLEELGWDDWVLAPRELDVRMCVGACPGRFRSANTHARMQARLHGRNPDAAPSPCCVPSAYEPVVLMHKDSAGRLALTPFEDLVASDCHCA